MYKKSKSNEEFAAELIQKADKAFANNERHNSERTWAELAEFILESQNSGFYQNRSQGQNRDSRVFDNTAPLACRDLTNAWHSTVTNPSTHWIKYRFSEANLNNSDEALNWLSLVDERVFQSIAESNFDNQIGKAYESYIGLGTGAILHDEISENGQFKKMNFSSWALSEIAYAENYLGVVDYICRRFYMTNKQIVEQFGLENVPDKVKEDYTNKPLEENEIYHCVYPRPNSEIKLNAYNEAVAKYRPFASCYILKSCNFLLKEDGYYELPVYVFRWSTRPGEIYGRGPGHLARASTLTLNVISRDLLKGLGKAISPVIFQEQGNIISRDLRPNTIVTVRNINGYREGTTQARFDIGFLQAKELKDSIKSAFYIDKLMLPPRTETGEMTAYEVRQRLEQMQTILGAPLSRNMKELHEPMAMRTLKMLMRAGRIPPIPKLVLDQSESVKKYGSIDIDISYINSLARSQQMEEIRNISSWIQETAMLAQIGKTEALDRINADAITEKIARIRDIDETLVVGDEEVAQIRKQREDLMQAQTMLQAGQQVGSMAKDLSSLKEGNI